MLIQTIYVSKASTEMTDADLKAILEKAVANNAAKDITGLLLYTNHDFMQVLEGERRSVDALIEKIRLDTRHDDVRVVARTDIKNREFKQWSMGLHHILDVDAALRPHIQSFFESGFDENGLCTEPDIGISIMRALADAATQES